MTLSEPLPRSSGISCCNLEMRSVIWASVISLETPDCLERDLLLDIVNLSEFKCVCVRNILLLLLKSGSKDKGERERKRDEARYGSWLLRDKRGNINGFLSENFEFSNNNKLKWVWSNGEDMKEREIKKILQKTSCSITSMKTERWGQPLAKRRNLVREWVLGVEDGHVHEKKAVGCPCY